jgi:predicted RNA binding protein YcfA (HicA-like mRNA interferase family)
MSKQILHKEIRSLVREIEDLGFVVNRDKGNHTKVFTPDGRFVYSLPTTPGRGRWKQNLISELRKRGVLAGVSGRT